MLDCHQYWLRLITAAAADDVMDILHKPLWHVPAWSNDVIRVRPLEEWHHRAINTRWLSFFVIPQAPKSVITTSMASISCQSSHAQSPPHLSSSHPWIMKQSSDWGEWKSNEVSVCQYDIKSFISVLNWRGVCLAFISFSQQKGNKELRLRGHLWSR